MRCKILFSLVVVWLAVCAGAQAPVPAFSASAEGGCSPLVTSFTDQSTGNPTAWFWDFGNGATSTLKNPSTTYFIPGSYTVSLTVTNASGVKTISRPNFITVYGNPEVGFTVDDSTGCFPFPVQFTDVTKASAGATNTAWSWDFGDGTQATGQNPKHTFLHAGNYTISLRVANDKGCWSVATRNSYIRVDGGIKADFRFTQTPTCQAPFPVQFSNTSVGPGVVSYTWHFGDSTASTEANPLHTYATPGVYSVVLIAKSSDGCSDTLRKENLLNLQQTTTAFTAPDSLCVGDAVSFQNQSSGAAVSRLWLFGDGTTSAAVSPLKTYTTPGTYTIRLQQAYGHCEDSAQKTVQVFPRPKAGFTSGKTTDCQLPFTASFQNTSTDALTYAWDFGDGTTSTETNPVHTYTSFGIFTVTLTVTNTFGCRDVMTFPGLVKLAKPSIILDSLPRSGCVPYGLNFTARINATNAVTHYRWDFGNGDTSTAANPAYTYTEQGTYTVQLTVTTASGCTETVTLPRAITVGRRPKVGFSAQPNKICAFQEAMFTNTTNEGSVWQWIFGDGSTSQDKNPRHEFVDTGTFSVKLIADNNGCKDSLEIDRYITIKPPISRFDVISSCNNRLFFTFADRSVGATRWQWDFGDGNTSTEKNPSHRYQDYGLYVISLTVGNDTCSHISRQTIKIANGTPDFTASVSSLCKGGEVGFKADTTNADNILRYSWNFGNGQGQASGRETTHTFPAAGNYSVSLTVEDINGCIDSTVKRQLVQINGPTAGLIASNNNGCKGLLASFTDASKDDGRSKIATWTWNLGDGTVIQKPTPEAIQHVYANAGSYNVSLTVKDAIGCADSLTLYSLVNASDIKAAFESADTLSCPGATVRFSNTSQARSAYQSVWSFGNGSTSTEQHPNAAYNTDGRYTVSLKIKDIFGCADSLAQTDYILVRRPVASFTVNDTASACIPFPVYYTNTSTYYLDHVWDLNGGTSRLPSPTQFYNFPGTYQTRLIVTSPGGCTDTAVRTISVFDASASKLAYLPLSGCKPLTVDLSAVSPVKMNLIWDLGDGTIIKSNDTVQRHVYNFFGDFVPKIIFTNSSGCVVPVTGLDTIRIEGATTRFGLATRLLCDSGVVRFTDSTTFNNPISTYNWNFGDGTTSSVPSPAHFYAKPGIYPVTLSVQTQNACVDTFKLAYPVKVVASPSIRIDGDSVVCIGEGMTHLGLFDRADTAKTTWAWQFPNGATATAQMPQRQVYAKAGKFVVEALAVNSSGCTDTALKTIYVNPLPSVTLPQTIHTRLGTPVLLPAVYTGNIQSYNWSVPDGLSCFTCPQPFATPKTDTKYYVSFLDNNGCRNTGEVEVRVLCNNDNVFIPNTFSPNGDGSNDIFYVRGKGLSRVKMLRIFNRWGQVVFERANFNVNDASAGWDGTFRGAKPIPDVYVYQVEIFCDNNLVITFDGNVALVQ